MPSDWTKNKGGARTGLPTSIRRCLSAAGFKPTIVRRNFQYSGYVVVGGSRDTVVMVSWRPNDDMPESTERTERTEFLDAYAEALTAAGFRVSKSEQSLSVQDKPRPKGVWKEVHHASTGDLVGWLRPGEFRDVTAGKPIDL